MRRISDSGRVRMIDTGVKARMKILDDSVDRNIVDLLTHQGWSSEIAERNEAGEYIIVECVKSEVTKRVALLYTSATDNAHYKALDSKSDAIYTNGELYHIESYA